MKQPRPHSATGATPQGAGHLGSNNAFASHLRTALLSMRGNLTAALSTLTTMTLALLVLGGVLLLNQNIERVLENLEQQVEVSAFLTPQANAEALLSHVRALPDVSSAELVSSGEALDIMTRDYPFTAEAVALAGNPFPNTLRIQVRDVENTRVVAKAAELLQGVESVEFGAQYVDGALQTLGALRLAGWVLVGLLLLGTLLSILSAVQVSMYARRGEIEVMRLLGATRSFIQWPHVLEGLLLGLGAALLAGGILLPLSTELTRRLSTLIPALPLVQEHRTLLGVWLALGVLGAGVGLLGGWLASRRYLQELE